MSITLDEAQAELQALQKLRDALRQRYRKMRDSLVYPSIHDTDLPSHGPDLAMVSLLRDIELVEFDISNAEIIVASLRASQNPNV